MGRYLSPDPILLSPTAVVEFAAQGRSTPAYAYANNNPITLTDPTGEVVVNFDDLPGHVQQAIMGMRESAVGNAAWQNLENSSTVFRMESAELRGGVAGRVSPMEQSGGYQGSDNPDTVVVSFDGRKFPQDNVLSRLFGTGLDSYMARNVTGQWLAAHELAGHAQDYIGPASSWRPPRNRTELDASELRAECAASRVTGIPLNPGVKCP
ncbi:MAG: hypothetical protein M3Q39_06910 [Actinomycetota bacterium]|nr:hypothetical protein [Actinomycetota bacterium]